MKISFLFQLDSNFVKPFYFSGMIRIAIGHRHPRNIAFQSLETAQQVIPFMKTFRYKQSTGGRFYSIISA